MTVIGAGASAFDNAATTLEHGAARIDILVRRPVLPEVNTFRVLETTAGNAIRLRTPSGWRESDFLILGTGFAVDVATRPELAGLAPDVARWSDRYTPPRTR